MRTQNKLHQELKHQFVLEKLLEKGVTISQDGIDIRELSYADLKYEWLLLAFREIDTQNDKSGWF